MPKQTTRKCHILPKWYMKNFLKSDGWIFVYQIKWNKVFEDYGKFDFWFYNDTYNYIDNYWKIIDNLEKYFAERESKLAKTTQKVIENIIIEAEKENRAIEINIKKNILSLMSLLYEKLFYYYYVKGLSKEIINEKKFLISFSSFALMIPLIQIFLKNLVNNDKFKRAIIYSKKPLFYFWDFPIHIRWNWKKNNLYDFLNRKWSNITFPISKNILILIEAPFFWDSSDELIKIIYREWIFSEFRPIHWKETLSEVVIYRTIENCSEYIAWPYKKILKKAYKWKWKSKIYAKDIVWYILWDKIPKIMKDLEETVSKLQNNYLDIFDSYSEKKIEQIFSFLNNLNSIKNYKIEDFIECLTKKTKEETKFMLKLPLDELVHTLIKDIIR